MSKKQVKQIVYFIFNTRIKFIDVLVRKGFRKYEYAYGSTKKDVQTCNDLGATDKTSVVKDQMI